jgi:hypothetical protein
MQEVLMVMGNAGWYPGVFFFQIFDVKNLVN